MENESTGRILYNYPIERFTTIFGQGTTVTAMQMVQAASAVANDGKMMKPYMVDKIVDNSNGKVIEQFSPQSNGNPISKEAAVTTRKYLSTTVTSDVGTGRPFAINGYQVAGKSGTAQIPNPDGSGYMYGHDNYLFSFLGMAPADNPKLVVYVGVQEPDLKGELGSIPVAKIFNPVMQNSLKYLNIKSTSTTPKLKLIKVPDQTGQKASTALKSLKQLGLVPVVVGNGDKIIGQSSNEELMENEKIYLLTDGALIVPDMKGWSFRDVLKYAKLVDLKVETKGNGYLTKQNISPGTKIGTNKKLIVEFSPLN